MFHGDPGSEDGFPLPNAQAKWCVSFVSNSGIEWSSSLVHMYDCIDEFDQAEV